MRRKTPLLASFPPVAAAAQHARVAGVRDRRVLLPVGGGVREQTADGTHDDGTKSSSLLPPPPPPPLRATAHPSRGACGAGTRLYSVAINATDANHQKNEWAESERGERGDRKGRLS